MMGLLGLHSDQGDEKAGANEVQDNQDSMAKRKTRISFELHPFVFYEMYHLGVEQCII